MKNRNNKQFRITDYLNKVYSKCLKKYTFFIFVVAKMGLQEH